jgi:hypothetical protein
MSLVKLAFTTLDALNDDSSEDADPDPWPLFVIGIEAHTDEQRLKISELLARGLRRRDTGCLRSVQRMVEAWWVQDDLCEDGDEGDEDARYLRKMDAMVSAHRVIPMFM